MFKNREGFTLIEFLVALVIMMVGLLGLLQAVNLAMNQNLQNNIRDTAVTLGDEMMGNQMKKGYDNLPSPPFESFSTSSRPMFNAMKNYSVTTTVAQVSSGNSSSRQVTVLISWRHKNTRYEHATTGVVTKFQ